MRRVPVLPAEEWMDRAACRNTDPNVFFPTDSAGRAVHSREAEALAREICATCPVTRPCRAYAMRFRLDGIWGGTNRKERQVLARALRRAS